MADRRGSGSRNRNQTQIYNIVTAVMLALTLVACISALILGVTAPRQGAEAAAAPTATLFSLPTETSTVRPPTVNPTWTPEPTGTGEQEPTATWTPSATPTVTITGTPYTPRATRTATPTETPIASATSPATRTPTRAPFDYVLRNNSITYTSNFANNAGCDWAGIGGVVFDEEGNAQLAVSVEVTSSGDFSETVASGSATAYGTSGWEVYLNDQPIDNTFFVQLVTSTGSPLSEKIEVETVANCQSNLAFLVFDKVQ
jgi:hypothetical protein